MIELLAVIVILAIIALIAVPVVMNIITKSRKSAFKDSTYGIIKAGELYYANQLLELNGMEEDKTFDFSSGIEGLEIKGTKPTAGTMTVTKEGKVAIAVTDGKYCITKGFEDTDVTVTEDIDNCKNSGESEPIMTSVNSCIQAGNTCSDNDIKAGITVNVKVNDEQTEDFYVLADNGEKLTLILNRNLGDNVEWMGPNDYVSNDNCSYMSCNDQGPITALKELQSQTNTWTNLPEITNYTFTMYARLPDYSEINNIVTDNGGTMPTWLYINLYNTGDTTTDSNGDYKYAYWTSTTDSSNYRAYFVSNYGNITSSEIISFFGVRPVIKLSK